MNIYFFLSLVWIVLGAGLIIWDWTDPKHQMLRLRGTDFSAGWLILVLALWNLVRWWNSKAQERDRRFEEEMTYQRQNRNPSTRDSEPEPKRAPDPNFDFSKPSPPEDGIQEKRPEP